MGNKIFDYVICEGSLAGCLAAVYWARKGYSVAVVERRGFLGSDITATLKKFSCWELRDRLGILGELADCFCNPDGSVPENGESKRRLLSWVEQSGAEVFLALEPCALLLNENQSRAAGVMLAGKWGYFFLKGKCLIDASCSGVLQRMVSDKAWQHADTARLIFRYQTAAGTGAMTENACLETVFSVGETDDPARMLLKGQKELLKEWKLLKKSEAGVQVWPGQVAYESYIAQQSHMEVCKEAPNLYHIYAGEDLSEGLEQVMQWLPAGNRAPEQSDTEELYYIKNREVLLCPDDYQEEEWEVCETDLPFRKVTLHQNVNLPVLSEADVVVAGGGTAGVAAALGAAREGARVVAVEYHNGYGGTQTYGGIPGYYLCHKNGFANQSVKEMEEAGLQSSMIERMLWYRQAMEEEGIQMYNGAVACDVVKENHTIQGIAVVRDGYWGIIKGKVTVDATGDGDLMEFAGVPHRLGAADSFNVQDSGVIHYRGTGYDLDAIYQSKYEEVLRGMRMAHAFGGGTDFSPLLTPREGRLFEGEYTLDMGDVLLGRHFPDTIALAYTDNDPHGAQSSEFSYMGLTPFHGEPIKTEIPYRACIPKGYSGLLGAAKSISATQDAAGYTRMAADVQNRGYAIGTAAAMAALAGCDVREISVEKLRRILRHVRILDGDCFRAQDECTSGSRQQLVEGLKAWDRDSMARVLSLSPEEILPVLRKTYEREKDCAPLEIALAWFGEREVLPELKRRLWQLAEQENIDDYTDKYLSKPGNNMGGILGQIPDYWKINQLLTVFARLEETGIEEEVLTLISRFTAGGEPVRRDTRYVSYRWDLHKIPHYDRLRSLLLYISRVPRDAYGKELEALAERERLTGFLGGREVYDAHNAGNEDRCVGRQYQSAYMELSLGEALYQCGSIVGREILERGLKDVHYILRRRAYAKLKEE